MRWANSPPDGFDWMITKFIEPWVLFPGLLVLLLLVLAAWSALLARRYRALVPGRTFAALSLVSVLLLVVAAGLYAASTPVVANLLMRRIESSVPPLPRDAILATQRADYVIVLGGGTISASPAEGGRPALAAEAESRVLYGYRLARRLGVPLVLSGGTVFGHEGSVAEAAVAANLVRELGFPEDQVIVEDRSRTTAENARYTAALVNPQNPIVVTSAYHMRRSMLAFAQAGVIRAVAAPCAFRGDTEPIRPDMFLPRSRALDDSATVWRETVGYYWYRLSMARD